MTDLSCTRSTLSILQCFYKYPYQNFIDHTSKFVFYDASTSREIVFSDMKRSKRAGIAEFGSL